MTSKIRKAVFPVAGFGTRFLPATKAIPKEMLPIIDKPVIQYAVEEAIAAGIKQMIFVTSIGKRSIEDHFDRSFELETKLKEKAKYDLLSTIENILPHGVSYVCVRQSEQLGLGHAVLCAKDIVGEEPFAVLLPDDLIAGESSYCLQQMMEVYQKNSNSILAVQEVPHSETNKYGIVELDKKSPKPDQIIGLVEKPDIDEAPSNLAVIGRYILSPRIFYFLENIDQGAIGEIQLTDGIAGLLNEEQINICRFKGKRYDCGSKLGFIQATVEYALRHSEVNVQFAEYLRNKFACKRV